MVNLDTSDAELPVVPRLPTLYYLADDDSLRGQTSLVRATRGRLVVLVVTAALGVLAAQLGDDVAWIGWLLALLLGLAMLWEGWLWRNRPDKAWYDGRAAAESVKTLAWKYMSCGLPFDATLAPDEANSLLVRRLEEIRQQFPAIKRLPIDSAARHITSDMEIVRQSSLAHRRDKYLNGRVEDQRSWYYRKSIWNDHAAKFSGATLLGLEALGIVAAILEATGRVKFDLVAIFGALATAGIAWVSFKQYSSLSEAYAIASQELADIASKVEHVKAEQDWAKFVDEAEEAISREHTTWRASHSWPVG